MNLGEQGTGNTDEQYNLISTLYHALHGAEIIEAYVLDAEAAGDERLAEFFREALTTHRQLAGRAKELLDIPEALSGSEAMPDVSPEGGVAPGDISGGMPQGAPGGIPPGAISGGTPPP